MVWNAPCTPGTGTFPAIRYTVPWNTATAWLMRGCIDDDADARYQATARTRDKTDDTTVAFTRRAPPAPPSTVAHVSFDAPANDPSPPIIRYATPPCRSAAAPARGDHGTDEDTHVATQRTRTHPRVGAAARRGAPHATPSARAPAEHTPCGTRPAPFPAAMAFGAHSTSSAASMAARAIAAADPFANAFRTQFESSSMARARGSSLFPDDPAAADEPRAEAPPTPSKLPTATRSSSAGGAGGARAVASAGGAGGARAAASAGGASPRRGAHAGAALRFPGVRTSLWDRTPAGPPLHVAYHDVVPTFLVAGALARELSDMAGAAREGCGEEAGALRARCTRDAASPHDVVVLYALAAAGGGRRAADACVLPLHVRPAGAAAAAAPAALRGATAAALGMSVCVSVAASRDATTRESVGAVATVSVALPAIALELTPLTPLLLHDAPLSHALAAEPPPDAARPLSDDDSALDWGFLTLDAARRAVPLLRGDALVASTPTVGVWVRAAVPPPPSGSPPARGGGGAKTPAAATRAALTSLRAWAACCGFLADGGPARARHFVEPGVFLVLVFQCTPPGDRWRAHPLAFEARATAADHVTLASGAEEGGGGDDAAGPGFVSLSGGAALCDDGEWATVIEVRAVDPAAGAPPLAPPPPLPGAAGPRGPGESKGSGHEAGWAGRGGGAAAADAGPALDAGAARRADLEAVVRKQAGEMVSMREHIAALEAQVAALMAHVAQAPPRAGDRGRAAAGGAGPPRAPYGGVGGSSHSDGSFGASGGDGGGVRDSWVIAGMQAAWSPRVDEDGGSDDGSGGGGGTTELSVSAVVDTRLAPAAASGERSYRRGGGRDDVGAAAAAASHGSGAPAPPLPVSVAAATAAAAAAAARVSVGAGAEDFDVASSSSDEDGAGGGPRCAQMVYPSERALRARGGALPVAGREATLPCIDVARERPVGGGGGGGASSRRGDNIWDRGTPRVVTRTTGAGAGGAAGASGRGAGAAAAAAAREFTVPIPRIQYEGTAVGGAAVDSDCEDDDGGGGPARAGGASWGDGDDASSGSSEDGDDDALGGGEDNFMYMPGEIVGLPVS